MGFRREFVGDIHQKKDNQGQCKEDLNVNTNFPEVAHFTNSVSHQTVINMNNIPNKIPIINPINSLRSRGGDIVRPINEAINRAAEILIDKAEYALSQGFVNNFSTDYISIRVHSKCQFEHTGEAVGTDSVGVTVTTIDTDHKETSVKSR